MLQFLFGDWHGNISSFSLKRHQVTGSKSSYCHRNSKCDEGPKDTTETWLFLICKMQNKRRCQNIFPHRVTVQWESLCPGNLGDSGHIFSGYRKAGSVQLGNAFPRNSWRISLVPSERWALPGLSRLDPPLRHPNLRNKRDCFRLLYVVWFFFGRQDYAITRCNNRFPSKFVEGWNMHWGRRNCFFFFHNGYHPRTNSRTPSHPI